MIAPEQWYEYQKQYQKYGIDMKPWEEREQVRRRSHERQKISPLARGLALSVGSDRKLMLSLVLVGAVVLIMVVLMASYAAKLTYDIDKIQAANNALIGEIEDLDVKIMASTNISYIEDIASDKLDMKHPGTKNCVYISADDVPETGFADMLRDKAYK